MLGFVKRYVLMTISMTIVTLFVSCSGGRERDMSFEIVGFKWSIDPYVQPDGSVLDILLPANVDHHQYYAFNRDGTVDYFFHGVYRTGIFSIDGNLVTCQFAYPVWHDTVAIELDSGDYNTQIVLQYKKGRLYKYDYQTLDSNNMWVSDLPEEYKTLYYSRAGFYINRKYNAERFTYGNDYDTTVDGMTVEERFDWRRETYYKDGKRNGIYKEYCDGRLRVFGNYANGKPTGEWYYFGPEGMLEDRKAF